jgi:hypothetical protein
LWVALSRNLLYRRLGHVGLAAAQLDLSIAEFAFYRTFMELAPFLAVLFPAALRLGRATPGTRLLWRAGFAVVGSVYAVNVVVNSRLWAVLFGAAVYGVLTVTAARPRSVRPERAVFAVVAVLLGFYALRVSENVRGRIANGGSAFDPANLLPTAPPEDGDLGVEWRLNGVDLMAMIADRVEAEGPALGRAWAVPLLVSLDPIVRTSLTEQLKRAALTTAKSYLLLAYAGVGLPDYYSCSVSDAYGNLGLAGFVVVAVTLGGLVAYATAGLVSTAAPGGVVLACFVLSRILPFEQEFATLLFGWFKLVPLVGAVLLINPLGRATAPLAARGRLAPALVRAGPALPA